MKKLTTTQINSLSKYIESVVHDEIYGIGDSEEITFVCPFCGGGNRKEHTFDMNLRKGVGRCWRANNCGWKGSVYSFIMQVSNVEFEQAKDILNGAGFVVSDMIKDLDNTLHELMHDKYSINEDPLLVEEYFEAGEIDFNEWDKVDEVKEWIYSRGYEPDSFLEQHELFGLEKDINSVGRVGFRVRSNESVAFQLYTYDFSLQDKKTYNAPGQCLSKMVYNYNNLKKEREVVFVNEGIYDSARLISWGLSAGCIFGVNISDYQLFLLSDLPCEEICFLLDHGTLDVVLGTEDKKGHIERLSEITDKKISYMEIEDPSIDPDKFTQDVFLDYYGRRRVRRKGV